jgi:hypothetical protein
MVTHLQQERMTEDLVEVERVRFVAMEERNTEDFVLILGAVVPYTFLEV